MRTAIACFALACTTTFAATPLVVPMAAPPGAQGPEGGYPVRFNAAELAKVAPGETVRLALPSGATHDYTYERSIEHGGGIVTWIAKSADVMGDSARAIVTYSPAGAWGWMNTPAGQYRIYPGPTNDWLAKRAPTSVAPKDGGTDEYVSPGHVLDGPAELITGRSSVVPAHSVAKLGYAKATPSDPRQVDVMFLYTDDIATKLGAGLMPMLYNVIASVNQAYVDSEIAQSIRMVYAQKINYSNSKGSGATLDAMRGAGTDTAAAAVFDGLTWSSTNSQTLRTTVGADLVAVMRDGPNDVGGVAYLLRGNNSVYPVVTATDTNAFSVNNFCVSGCEDIVAHEMGHNMGNTHDRATVARDSNAQVPQPTGVFAYSFGHYFCGNGYTCNPFVANGCPSDYRQCVTPTANDFGTVMSYVRPRVMKFANPNIFCPSASFATRCGVDAADTTNSADTARSMNEVRQNNSALRNETIAALPGSVQFTATGYSVGEGGTMNFIVARTGGSAGALSATYTITPNSATATVDYTGTTGTVSWAAGDTANKIIAVPILNEGVVEGVESFTMTLSNPVGNTGAFIGHPSSAIGTLVEAWPPGGAVPAGFTSVGAGAGWTVASDFSSDGDGTSLKSGAIAFPCPPSCSGTPVPEASTLQYVNTFAAGTLSFGYQVNSYPGFGFFEFLVDGAVVLTASGVPTPKTFSYPLTAGTHTLQWRYRPVLNFPCSNGNPPPPQGNASCTDRAWIDSVSLPLPLLPSTVGVASSAPTSVLGAGVTFTATLTGNSGGTVAFRDGGVVIAGCAAQPITGNTATCTTSALAAGTHTITAAYSGTSGIAASISPSLVQTVVATVSLAVTKSGTGSGTVTSSVGGLNCGATCTVNVNAGAAVTLTAAASGGSVFSGWSGACSGTGACNLTPIANTSVGAAFSIAAGAPTLTANNSAGLAFGGQSVKTTTPGVIVDLVNTGTGTLTLSAIALAGTNVGDFAIAHSCTGVALTLGQSCPVTVTFTPQAAGARSAALNVTTSAGPYSFGITGTGEQTLVTHYYRSILRRAPDAPGKAFWESEATRMQSSGVNINETWYSMAQAFYSSPEYVAFGRDNNGFVSDLYNTFFNRAADGPGLAFWTGQIGSGMPREVVLASFMFSTEFVTFTQGIFGNTQVRKEIDTVTDFYRGLLGRLPDGSGLTFWIGQFRGAQCAGINATNAVNVQAESISSSFATGGEYAARARTNAQYVGDLYNAFLRRGGDLAGVQFWVNSLNGSTLTREQVRQNFVASAEFQGRVGAIIAQGCLP